jgi:hypothetical protein
MVEESGFRGAIDFLGRIGVYDIVLPFLLVFTIVFALLEKTKVLGVEEIGGVRVSKKNLNSIIAFVVAFLVIASSQLVAVISEVMSHVVLLMVLIVSFLLLVGTFFGDKEFSMEEYPSWIKFFMILVFIGIVLIFLNALDWLQYITKLFENWNADWAVSIILFVILIGFMLYIVGFSSSSSTSSSSSSKKKE